MESSTMTEATVLTQDPRPTRRKAFEIRQAEHARRFALRERVAAIIKQEIGPLAIDVREQQSPVHILVLGANGLPHIRLVLDGCGVHDSDEDEQFNVEDAEPPAGVHHDRRSRS
jgi:hypothetical protein